MGLNFSIEIDEPALTSAVQSSVSEIARHGSFRIADEVRVWTGRTRKSARFEKAQIYGDRIESKALTGGITIADKDTSEYVPLQYVKHPEQYTDAILDIVRMLNDGSLLNYQRQSPDKLYLRVGGL